MEVSEACQINDLDHPWPPGIAPGVVSEACQINDLDHTKTKKEHIDKVSEACQINDLDHWDNQSVLGSMFQKPVRSMT